MRQFIADLRARSVTPHVAIDGHVRKGVQPRATVIDRRAARHLDLEQRILQSLDDPFGPSLSPM